MNVLEPKTRRRLLIVTDCAHGGTFHVARMLATGLCGDLDVTLAAPVEGDVSRPPEASGQPDVTLLPTALSYENLERSSFDQVEAMRLLDASRPDLIVSCDGAELSSLIAVKTVARRRGIPYVVIVNLLSEDVRERFASLLGRSMAALDAAAAVVFVSAASRRRFERLFPDVACRREVVANSASEAFFAPPDPVARREMRMALGVAEGDLLCFTAARIEERKGQALVAAALGRLRQAGRLDQVRWVIAGRVEDWDRDKFDAAAAQAGIADRVIILGERSDIPALMDASDVFVLTSYAEGMPLGVIEALAKRVPVVATAIDGIVEQLDESCGILLPPPAGDEAACIDACAAALDHLQSDRPFLARLSAGAAARAKTLFHPSIGIARYRALLADLVSRTDTAPAIEPDFSIAPGASLDFSAPEVAWNHLDHGWTPCETGGVQTDGRSSSLRLDLAEAQVPVRLMFDVTPLAKRRDRSTRVFVNGIHVSTWRFGVWRFGIRRFGIGRGGPRRQRRGIVIDPRVSGQKILVRLDNPGAVRPCDIGLGSDWRERALLVHRVEVTAAAQTFRATVGHRWRAWLGLAGGPGSAPA